MPAMRVLTRSASLELLRQWDRTVADAGQGARRLEMLGEVGDRWKKTDETRKLVARATEMLVQAQLDQGKWAAAFPLIRELLDRSSDGLELDRRLGLLLKVGERALLEGDRAEAQRAVQEAQPFLPRSNGMAIEFEKLNRQARARP